MGELVPPGFHIDVLGKAKLCMALSLAVIVIGLSAIVWRGGLQPGIDFSGGTLIQLRFSQPADLGTVREALDTVGWERAIVQHDGGAHEVFIHVAQGTNAGQDIGAQVQRALQHAAASRRHQLERGQGDHAVVVRGRWMWAR